jgi:glycosyltransferase involved in cell wall biosynthesis
MRILHLMPSLHYSGAAKQMATICLGMPRDRFEIAIGALGGNADGRDSSLADLLRSQDISVHVLGKTRRFDPLCLWNLRQLLKSFRPDLIHAWGASCVRSLTLAAVRSAIPVVAANALALWPKSPRALWRSWLLTRPARIIACGQAEADRYLQAGVSACKIIPVAPAIAQLPLPPDSANAARSLPQEGKRYALCAGSMETHKGFRNAVWSLDILKFLFDELHLVLVGDGPDRANLERFAQGIQLDARVHFFGACADVRPFLDRADLVWVPSLGDCGVHITLEAMAAGKPVVASNVPSLREIIRNGETGFLIPPGDKVALGRRTRELLRNPDLARRMGEAGRRQVASLTPAYLVERVAEIYCDVAA